MRPQQWTRPAARRLGPDGGFTLIELMVVLALIMMLASISLLQYRNSVTYARESALASDLFHMREAIDQYYADKGEYPDSIDTLVSEGYIRAVPVDPITGSSATWQTIQASPQPGALSASPGIYDVRSGADGTALDGRLYSEF